MSPVCALQRMEGAQISLPLCPGASLPSVAPPQAFALRPFKPLLFARFAQHEKGLGLAVINLSSLRRRSSPMDSTESNEEPLLSDECRQPDQSADVCKTEERSAGCLK